MQEELDLTDGWCCDGRTWHEHAEDDGHCCQSRGTNIRELPSDGQEKARDRLAREAEVGSEGGVSGPAGRPGRPVHVHDQSEAGS